MKKGDKFVIEISEIHTHYDDNGQPFRLARIKGFSTLTFDKKGLERLEKLDDCQDIKYWTEGHALEKLALEEELKELKEDNKKLFFENIRLKEAIEQVWDIKLSKDE